MQSFIVRLWRLAPEAGQGFQGFRTPIVPEFCAMTVALKGSVSTPFEFCVRLLRARYHPDVEESSHAEEAARGSNKTNWRTRGTPACPSPSLVEYRQSCALSGGKDRGRRRAQAKCFQDTLLAHSGFPIQRLGLSRAKDLRFSTSSLRRMLEGPSNQSDNVVEIRSEGCSSHECDHPENG